MCTEGEWGYRVNDDDTATIVQWLGEFDSSGAVATVPETLGGHPLRDLEDDPIQADSVASLVDDGWYPPATIESAPHSPARIWAASHCSDYLYWEALPTDDPRTCTYTVLADGTARIDTWWSDDKVLDIPATIDGRPVTAIGEGAFSFCEFEQVTVPDGVTTIGEHAFVSCDELQTVVLPDSVVSLGRGAFADCWFTSIRLSAGLERIEPYTFMYCWKLKQIVVPEGVRELGAFAFSDTHIAHIELPASICHIDDTAFVSTDRYLEIVAPEGSYARRWCENHQRLIGIHFVDYFASMRG